MSFLPKGMRFRPGLGRGERNRPPPCLNRSSNIYEADLYVPYVLDSSRMSVENS